MLRPVATILLTSGELFQVRLNILATGSRLRIKTVVQTKIGIKTLVTDRQLIVLNNLVRNLRAVIVLLGGKLVAAGLETQLLNRMCVDRLTSGQKILRRAGENLRDVMLRLRLRLRLWRSLLELLKMWLLLLLGLLLELVLLQLRQIVEVVAGQVVDFSVGQPVGEVDGVGGGVVVHAVAEE